MSIRPGTSADYDAFVRLFAELGSGDPPPSRAWWDGEAAPRTLVFEKNGNVLAYGFVDRFGDVAHVSQVAVDAGVRGRGIGRAMMKALGARARAEGATRWQLNVKVDNVPAIALYESLGFRTVKRQHALVAPWAVIESLPRTASCRVRALDPSEDADAEAQFQLPEGIFARRRTGARTTHVLAVVPLAAERPFLGVASFTPSMPGSKPFQIAAPEYGASLVAGFLPHRDPADLPLHMAVEDDRFAEELVRAGASPKFVAFHMRGAIPA